MPDLDKMLDAYIECALWSSTQGEGDVPMDDDYGIEDIAPETLATMRGECAAFLEEAGPILTDLQGYTIAQAGHDFWLTRNRHGAGFWDRGLGDAGQKLTDMAHAWGSADLYIGDDGRVYQS